MFFDLSALPARDRYKLLIGLVVPRPIALVTSQDENGVVNAAPFSFFNVLGSDPPILALGVGNRDKITPKDTARNIRASGEFVVHLVDEDLAPAMNICATDFPAGVSEIEAAKLELSPSQMVQVPRIASAVVALECAEAMTVEIGRNRVILGEIRAIHVRDGLVDAEKFYVKTDELHLIGRMGGAGGYTRTRDGFQIPRVSFEEWQCQQEKSG